MESVTNRSSPTLGMSATGNILPSRSRSFRIASPWSEFHPNRTPNGSAKAPGKYLDGGRQISIFATVVEVSRSKTGSLRSKISNLRPRDSRVRVVRPDIFGDPTFDTRQQMAPPNRSKSAPPIPRTKEYILPPNRSNSAPPIDSIWQQESSPNRNNFVPPVDIIKEQVSSPDRNTFTPPVDRIREQVSLPNSGPSALPIETKQQILPPNLESSAPSTPKTPKAPTRKNTLRERTQSRLAGLKHKFFRSSSSRKVSQSLPEICSELAQIPVEEVSNPQTAKCQIFKEEPIRLEVKSLGNKKFKMLLPISQGASGLGISEEEEEEDESCDRFIEMLPESCQHISQKASPLGLVPRLFPHGKVRGNVRYVASCFWIWLCMVDGRPTFCPRLSRK